ncbi:ABC transporter ATP-binding protein [Streptomyces sp. NPDC001530]|uniref:ABC transporter ATP-binding protein n=1 Tax=Streptomyces sp. NPDC001530 TaxID=3364582 RepID=UPI0036BAF832
MNNTSAPSSPPPVLSGIGLSKSFGSTHALDGVDISVRAGESLAVMGPSGSGKSTLLHCLANTERPDSGQVLLDGERIDQLREPDRSELRRTRFGFLFQFGQLLPELPAVENVALPLMLGGVARREAERRARQWFAPLGLEGKEDSRPGQLSGGQAQRVALARALVGGAQVVFADEPTGALDQATGKQVTLASVQLRGTFLLSGHQFTRFRRIAGTDPPGWAEERRMGATGRCFACP